MKTLTEITQILQAQKPYLAEKYGITEPSLINYGRDFSQTVLAAYPDRPDMVKQAVFTQFYNAPQPQDDLTLLNRCMSIKNIEPYCRKLKAYYSQPSEE